MSRPASSSRLHDLFLPHREAPSGPSPERDADVPELQRVPDMAPRAWQPAECDLSRGLSKVKGSLQASGWGSQGDGRGFSRKAAVSVGSVGWLSVSLRRWYVAGIWRGHSINGVEVGMRWNGEQCAGDRPARGEGVSLRKV